MSIPCFVNISDAPDFGGLVRTRVTLTGFVVHKDYAHDIGDNHLRFKLQHALDREDGHPIGPYVLCGLSCAAYEAHLNAGANDIFNNWDRLEVTGTVMSVKELLMKSDTCDVSRKSVAVEVDEFAKKPVVMIFSKFSRWDGTESVTTFYKTLNRS